MRRVAFLAAACCITACASAPAGRDAGWWKGNLHTHSLWSDGIEFPEVIAAWYRDHGYNFIAITEHDMLQEGERWVDINAKDEGWPPRNQSARNALPGYRQRFGSGWVQERRNGKHEVRLRPLSEYRARFEEPGRFLFIMGEEITDRQGAHLNAFNLATAIQPRGGPSNRERIRNNLAAVDEQRRATGRTLLAIVNHPNYTWALTADDLADVPAARFFEVYNGHLLARNAGDAAHPSTDALWDAILAARHRAGAPPIYGVATDDAHDYGERSDTISRPGRGWVMVRASRLAPETILAAMAAGDFYASTGVVLRDVHASRDGLRLDIRPAAGVTFRTSFIGTRTGGPAGEVFAVIEGTTPSYTFRGDEVYVRARVVSSAPQLDAIGGQRLGWQSAWTQPVFRVAGTGVK